MFKGTQSLKLWKIYKNTKKIYIDYLIYLKLYRNTKKNLKVPNES